VSKSEQHIKRIQDKLQQLLKQYTSLQKENLVLKEELGMRNQEVLLHQKNADELKQQVSVLKLNAGELTDADKKEFERKINFYIKEIDRCIALLGT
jgi:chromosome segregation ATPase